MIVKKSTSQAKSKSATSLPKQGIGRLKVGLRQTFKPIYAPFKQRLDYWLFCFKLWRSLRQTSQVMLVHTTHKVGSTSVFKSLDSPALELGMPVYKTHFLSTERLAQMADYRKSQGQLHSVESGAGRCFVRGQFLHKKLDDEFKQTEWNIVTLIRDPVSFSISLFFHNLRQMRPQLYAGYTNGTLSTEEMLEHFYQRAQRDTTDWLNLEIRDIFGIDVFGTEFPKEQGYQVYDHGTARLLLIKLEQLNRCSEPAFKDFLKSDKFALKKANLAKSKGYYDAYKRFLDSVVLPESYLDEKYSYQYVRHFYSDAEIEAFKAKWRR